MISVKHLIHKYKDNTILNDVSFSQNKGTVTAIIGPSGSGKTTLLRTLNALAIPKSGTIQIGNKTFQKRDFPTPKKLRYGFSKL